MQRDIETKRDISDILKDAGCDDELKALLISLYENGSTDELIQKLSIHKASLLSDLHTSQRRIDCLDFLVYKIKKDNKSGGTLK